MNNPMSGFLDHYGVDMQVQLSEVNFTAPIFSKDWCEIVLNNKENYCNDVIAFMENCKHELSLITQTSGFSYDPTTISEWTSDRRWFWTDRSGKYVALVLDVYSKSL